MDQNALGSLCSRARDAKFPLHAKRFANSKHIIRERKAGHNMSQTAQETISPRSITPLPLSQAVLYFGLPALLFRISLYNGTPRKFISIPPVECEGKGEQNSGGYGKADNIRVEWRHSQANEHRCTVIKGDSK